MKRGHNTGKALHVALKRLGIFLIPGCLVMAFLSGCGSGAPSEESVLFGRVPEGEWSETWPMQLEFPEDSVPLQLRNKACNASLWVRYNREAPQNVRLVTECQELNGMVATDTVSLQLYDNGRPLGKGNYGLYELHAPLKNLPPPGDGFCLRIWPLETGVQGISDLGLTLTPTPGKSL